jgi:hypothetical protein
VVSIVLVILQPWAVGAWCTLCLVSALLCLATLPPAMDEAVASIQFLLRARRKGQSLWRTLLQGEVREGRPEAEGHLADTWFDLRTPWNLVLSALAGFWLMFTPAIFGLAGMLAHFQTLTGALVVTFAVMAMAEAGRLLRLANIAFGAWILSIPWVAGPAPSPAAWSNAAAGLCLVALSFRRGPVREHYGPWDRWIR